MIQSFKDRHTQEVFETAMSRRFPQAILPAAQRKLAALEAAVLITDLQFPRGNRLHQLIGDRTGQHSISINDQWRVCFVWKERAPSVDDVPSTGDVFDVEITDYH